MTSKNTQNRIDLNAEKRTEIGSKLNALRGDGYIPAVVYGKGLGSVAIKLPMKDFNKAFKEAGESTLLYLHIGDEEYPTIINDISRDAVSGLAIHADFYKVNLKEKITASVPVAFIGESTAVKDLKGIFIRNINELEVEALPQNLPHEISVDMSTLKAFGDQILASDIKLDSGVELAIDPETIIATVQEPMSEDELKASLEGEGSSVDDVEVIEKEKTEEESIDEEATPTSEAKE